jgi:hypothetical protein
VIGALEGVPAVNQQPAADLRVPTATGSRAAAATRLTHRQGVIPGHRGGVVDGAVLVVKSKCVITCRGRREGQQQHRACQAQGGGSRVPREYINLDTAAMQLAGQQTNSGRWNEGGLQLRVHTNQGWVR